MPIDTESLRTKLMCFSKEELVTELLAALLEIANPPGDVREKVIEEWFNKEIEAAKADQVAGFKAGNMNGSLKGERSHARQCALFEAKQMVLRALASPKDAEATSVGAMEGSG